MLRKAASRAPVPLSEKLGLGKITLELGAGRNVHGLVNPINCPFVGHLCKVFILGMRQNNMVEVKSEPVEEEFGDEKDTIPLPSTSRQMIASPIIRHRKVGFALMNDKGELPPSGDIWQFNY
ncbi:hypothetical protein PRIPAC_85718 [Pristionchus pacificus]|uniref:Uncharacterized protein n=1 Tax=Pristionchus pacificus TaxID=54126 RepID=A0A2A6BRU7_PRIPA|nr:hypothetical protein PRIPAC_85718 [Pristionchus pacificus]|eukprot:PDM68682.1 hypothetical protein PRIPAC_46984 [Pristionchus pacificus]